MRGCVPTCARIVSAPACGQRGSFDKPSAKVISSFVPSISALFNFRRSCQTTPRSSRAPAGRRHRARRVVRSRSSPVSVIVNNRGPEECFAPVDDQIEIGFRRLRAIAAISQIKPAQVHPREPNFASNAPLSARFRHGPELSKSCTLLRPMMAANAFLRHSMKSCVQPFRKKNTGARALQVTFRGFPFW